MMINAGVSWSIWPTNMLLKITAWWEFFNERLLGALDHSTRDITRLSYVPRDWEKSMAQIFWCDGFAFDVAELVRSGWQPASEAAQRGVQASLTPIPLVDALDGSSPPIGDPVITERMLKKFASSPQGGRFYKLLCSAAVRYKKNGWTLSVHDLVNAAEREKCTLGLRNSTHEAKNAISYVESHWSEIKANIDAKEQQRIDENEAVMNAALKRWGLK
jgi:hypothetical protein